MNRKQCGSGPEASSASCLDILFAEDDGQDLALLETLCAGGGHRCVAAVSGRQVEEVVGRQHFDLIFLDLHLSGGFGLELLPRLGELPKRPLIVAMTDEPVRELEERIRQERVAYYLVKPVTVAEIQAILNHLALRKSRAGEK